MEALFQAVAMEGVKSVRMSQGSTACPGAQDAGPTRLMRAPCRAASAEWALCRTGSSSGASGRTNVLLAPNEHGLWPFNTCNRAELCCWPTP